MIKKTLWFFFLPVICLSAAYAQIGASVDDFKTSKFAVAEGFAFRQTYLLTDDPVYKGKYAYNFFTADQRYKIQLIAEKKGKNIVFEYLFYPATDDRMLALKDGSITLDFIAQASERRIGIEQYISLVSEANSGARNIKYGKKIDAFFLSLTRYDTAQISGWGLGIHK
jgi:hypothetical protein